MAFIFGVATQEADLYKIFRDFMSGVGRPGKVVRSGTGNGLINNLIYPEGAVGLYETFTLTCVSTGVRAGTFSVVGSVRGVMPDAVVGTVYRQPELEFYVDFGSVDYALGDTFTISAASVPAGRPRFSLLSGKPGTKTETLTLTCTVAGVQEVGPTPFVPARFSVSGSVTGAMPELVQGLLYDTSVAQLTLATEPTSANQYTVGQVITLEMTINPLKAVSQEWQILRQVANPNPMQFGRSVPGTDVEMIMVGPGLSGDDSVYYGMTRAWDDSEARAHWVHYGMSGYIPSMTIGEQPFVQGGLSGNRPVHTFWSLNLPYVIIANGRCFKVLTRSNIYYSQSYAGLALPSTMPKYWGYPYFVGGTGDVRSGFLWSQLSSDRASFWNYTGSSAGCSAYMLDENKVWQPMMGALTDSASVSEFVRWGNFMYVWPSGMAAMYDVRDNLDGYVPVFRQALYPNYGHLDGVYAVPGRDGRQPEEIMVLRDGTRLYITQNHHRSRFNDFCGFELG